MFHYSTYSDFLSSEVRANLISWAIDNENKFELSTVTSGRSERRKSLRVRDFEPLETVLRERVLSISVKLMKDLLVPEFTPSRVETELVAHNDGAFFKRHVDRLYGHERRKHDRILTSVYYFFVEPKAFTGGALRLYSLDKEKGDNIFTDVLPEQNTLIVFPSWVPHEVMPVSCPSRSFAHSRFAVTCWLCREAE